MLSTYSIYLHVKLIVTDTGLIENTSIASILYRQTAARGALRALGDHQSLRPTSEKHRRVSNHQVAQQIAGSLMRKGHR